MKLYGKIVFYLSISTLMIILPSILLIWHQQRTLIFNQARIQAETLFKMIVITRQWVAENRDRIEPVPAVATKELSIYANKMSNFKFHITSDVLVNQENAPDEFEKRAIKYFKDGYKEYSEIDSDNNKMGYYRYMAPLYINESCMKCHHYHGYKTGDLRGGISVSIPLDNIEKAIIVNNRLYYTFGFITFTGILLTVLVLVNNLILKHVRVIFQAAKKVMTQDYSYPVLINSGDEIQEFSEAFIQMREKIAQNEEVLKSRLKEAVSKYVILNRELMEKNNELKGINRLRTDIIDTVAHEVRTPMTKILSYTELMQNPQFANDQEMSSKAFEVVRKNSLQLKKMFDQIITLNKLDHDRYEYFINEVVIYDLIMQELDFFEQEIKDKNIDLEIDVDDNLVINADLEAFTLVLKNLLSNSIKYNKQNGKIKIIASADGKSIVFYDSGFGVKKDELANIFSRFYRGTNVKKSISGTGLGLSIVYRIIRDHGWEISVDSEENVFTSFTITIS